MKVEIPEGWDKYFCELHRKLNKAFPERDIDRSDVVMILLSEERCREEEDRFVGVELPKW